MGVQEMEFPCEEGCAVVRGCVIIVQFPQLYLQDTLA